MAKWIECWTCNPRSWVRIMAPTEVRPLSKEPPTAPRAPQCRLPTARGVCALGWVKCREHISLLIILCEIVYVTNKAHLSLVKKYKSQVRALTAYMSASIGEVMQFSFNRFPEVKMYLCAWYIYFLQILQFSFPLLPP